MALGSEVNGGVEIRRNGKLFAAAAALLGVVAGVGVSHEASAGSAVGVAIVLAFLGVPCLVYLRGTLRRGPVITIDTEGFRDLRSDRSIRWRDVDAVLLRKRQGVFGEYHHLVLIGHGAGDDGEVDVPIDMLSLGWRAVVAAVEELSGRRVAVSPERGARTR